MRGRLSGSQPGTAAAPAPNGFGFPDGFAAPSLCVAAWPACTTFRDERALAGVAVVQSVIGAIRNIRGEMGVPLDARLDVLVAAPQDDARASLASAESQVRALANTGSLSIAATQEKAPFASSWVSGDLAVQVLISDEFRRAEVERLEKEIGFLSKGLEATRKKLSNESFTAKAPEAVVNAEKEKLAKYEADTAALTERLAALKG
jgi:valyl-tRNA synthetase